MVMTMLRVIVGSRTLQGMLITSYPWLHRRLGGGAEGTASRWALQGAPHTPGSCGSPHTPRQPHPPPVYDPEQPPISPADLVRDGHTLFYLWQTPDGVVPRCPTILQGLSVPATPWTSALHPWLIPPPSRGTQASPSPLCTGDSIREQGSSPYPIRFLPNTIARASGT